jgi:ribosomal protein S18 acetylase RimI-like enzyme
MKTKLEIIEPHTARGIWRLISEVMAKELGFPSVALEHFRQSFTDRQLAKRIKSSDGPIFIASKNGCLAGVLVGSLPEGGVGTIIWLIVSSEFRGLGAGKALFKQACKTYHSMGCHKVKLTATTPEAVKFYKKLGMSVEGQHISHWWMLDFWSLGKLLA